ncbi:hypothetical protein CISIN_1g016377mg [Citrus sinensis]|uniref:Uncharacterized protein n=1 Tax=Citrus sinensis TaxID=2711 RepID=A0A067F2U0_CITSI|nr:hypothetical protein CISIN_1g016377mg [Citrus sinensis]
MEKDMCKNDGEAWRVLEFYSGIGGMRYSLMKADVSAQVVEAFDINDKANDVYELNFGHRPYQAKRKPLSFRCQLLNNQLLRSPSPLLGNDDMTVITKHDQPDDSWDKLLESCDPVERFLEFSNSGDQVNTETGFLSTGTAAVDDFGAAEETVEVDRCVSIDHFLVPLSLIERWGSAMDIVYPDSKRCCCFTKSYYRYVKGTGSLLATVQPKNKGKASSLKEQHLRYFTPREVANLHSFPGDFQFPHHLSLRQRYALLGNSLSIAVVAPLLQYLFAQAG